MKNSKNSGGIIASALLMVVTLYGFFWLWNQAKPVEQPVVANPLYEIVDISGLKNEATTLIADKTNAGNLPVLVPTADRIGRANPYAGL